MFCLNYVKPNKSSVLCFTMHVKQNANNTESLLNYVAHKISNVFCFDQS